MIYSVSYMGVTYDVLSLLAVTFYLIGAIVFAYFSGVGTSTEIALRIEEKQDQAHKELKNILLDIYSKL
jgi:Na+-transporting methylmalonyl-CoA/oxaloacetate decarboxylase gamma subunit